MRLRAQSFVSQRLLTVVAMGSMLGTRSHVLSDDHDAGHTRTPVKHVVVIFRENVSFDHYVASYPNAANNSGLHPSLHREQPGPGADRQRLLRREGRDALSRHGIAPVTVRCDRESRAEEEIGPARTTASSPGFARERAIGDARTATRHRVPVP